MKERRFFFIILPALLILADSRQASAQQSISQQQDLDVHVRNLRIGDNVPDFHISKIINNDKPNAKISDFRNQLLILDFWDTYCPSCIQALPVLDSMQRLFGKQIRILPVTYQKEALMRNFFKKNPIAKNLTLPCIVEDKILSSAFRHWYISHEVWIYKGVVKAITYTEFINPINIRQVLNNEKLDWPVKNDIVDFDYDKQSLFKLESSTGQNYTLGGRKMYSVISGYQSGLKGLINTVIDTFNKTVRTYWVNKDILTSYYIAYREVGFNGLSTKSTGRLILEVKDSAKYFYRPEYGLNAVWDAKNMYCYESVLPMSVSKRERYQIAIAEMDAFWGLKSGWEKRKVPCLLLIRLDTTRLLTDTAKLFSSSSFKKMTIKTLLQSIEITSRYSSTPYPPIVDETNYRGEIELGSWDDIPSLRQALQARGFDIKEGIRELDMFVLSEK